MQIIDFKEDRTEEVLHKMCGAGKLSDLNA